MAATQVPCFLRGECQALKPALVVLPECFPESSQHALARCEDVGPAADISLLFAWTPCVSLTTRITTMWNRKTWSFDMTAFAVEKKRKTA